MRSGLQTFEVHYDVGAPSGTSKAFAENGDGWRFRMCPLGRKVKKNPYLVSCWGSRFVAVD